MFPNTKIFIIVFFIFTPHIVSSVEVFNCISSDRNVEECEFNATLDYCGYFESECNNNYCKREGTTVCELCKDPKVKFAVKGSCNFDKAVFCTDEIRKGPCDNKVTGTGVCGYNNEFCKQDCHLTYNNACLACSNPKIKYYVNGECTLNPKKTALTNGLLSYLEPVTNIVNTCSLMPTTCPNLFIEFILNSTIYKNVCEACKDQGGEDGDTFENKGLALLQTTSYFKQIVDTYPKTAALKVPSESEKIFCRDIIKKNDCPKAVDGVCAYIKNCTSSDCFYNEKNVCLACRNTEVEYITQSSCPFAITNSNISRSAWLFPEVGVNDFVNAKECTAAEFATPTCPEEIQPACAIKIQADGSFKFDMKMNKCNACSKAVGAGAQYYAYTDCDYIKKDPKKIVLPCTQNKISNSCTNTFGKVCGKLEGFSQYCDGYDCKREFTNECQACRSENIESFVATTCNNQFIQVDLLAKGIGVSLILGFLVLAILLI